MSLVKKLRTSMGLSQEAFAHLIGRSFGSIRMYETGRMPPAEVLAKLLIIARTHPGIDPAVRGEIEEFTANLFGLGELKAGDFKPAPNGIDPKNRAGVHAMLDYIIDNGAEIMAVSACNVIRLFFNMSRGILDVESATPMLAENVRKKKRGPGVET